MKLQIEHIDYTDDKLVNEVLCYYNNGEWIEYSKAELTAKFLDEQTAFDSFISRTLKSEDQWQ